MSPRCVVGHVRYMVIDEESCKSSSVEGSHGFDDIYVPISEKAFVERGHGSLNISKMHVENLVV